MWQCESDGSVSPRPYKKSLYNRVGFETQAFTFIEQNGHLFPNANLFPKIL